MRARLLALLLLGSGLAACAGQPGPRPAAPTPIAAGPAAPDVDTDASAYGLFLAGEGARNDGHFSAAAAYLGRAAAVEGEPNFLKARAFAAALRAGDIAAAADLAPDGPDASPEDKSLGELARAVEAMGEGKYKDAADLLTGLDLAYPFSIPPLLLAPYAAAGAGQTTAALTRPNLDGDPVGQFVADLDHASLEDRLGKRNEAEIDYKALIAQGDESGLATAAYGEFLERHGRWAEATQLFQARLTADPASAGMAAALDRAKKRVKPPGSGDLRAEAGRSLVIPAAALIGQKQTGAALDYLRLALRLDPDDGEAWLLVGDLLAQADPEASREAYEHVPLGSDNYVTARGKLAWSYQNAGDHDQALKLARETLAAAPGDRDALANLADILRANDQQAEAAGLLTKLIEAPGVQPDWRLYYLRAASYEALGQPDKTEADLQAALKLDPDEPELLNFQGYYWIDRGEHLKEALAMVQRAVAANPQSGEMVDSLGWAYYRLGDYAGAVSQLEQAIILSPGIPEVNDHLGDAYWRVGRRTEAVFQWDRVLSLAPDDKLKARVEAKLASPQGPDAPGAAPAPPAP